MKFQLIDIFAIAWIILSFLGGRLIEESVITNVNEEYMSKDSCKYYKGIFAIAIVLHHIATETNTSGLYNLIFEDFGALCVAVFFFISGYGLMKSHMGSDTYSNRFFSKRLSSILIPYIIITGIRWIECALMGEKYSFKNVMMGFVHGDPILPFSWYMIVITIFYIYFWVLMKTCRRHYFAMIVGACIGYVFYACVCYKIGVGSWLYMTAPIIIIGMFWALYEVEINKLLKNSSILYWGLYLFSMASIILLTIYVHDIRAYFSNDATGALIHMVKGSFFVINFILFTMKFRIHNKVLYFLGEISLEIYLVQGLVIKGPNLGISNEVIWSVYVIVSTIILAYAFHILDGKIIRGCRKLIKLD